MCLLFGPERSTRELRLSSHVNSTEHRILRWNSGLQALSTDCPAPGVPDCHDGVPVSDRTPGWDSGFGAMWTNCTPLQALTAPKIPDSTPQFEDEFKKHHSQPRHQDAAVNKQLRLQLAVRSLSFSSSYVKL